MYKITRSLIFIEEKKEKMSHFLISRVFDCTKKLSSSDDARVKFL